MIDACVGDPAEGGGRGISEGRGEGGGGSRKQGRERRVEKIASPLLLLLPRTKEDARKKKQAEHSMLRDTITWELGQTRGKKWRLTCTICFLVMSKKEGGRERDGRGKGGGNAHSRIQKGLAMNMCRSLSSRPPHPPLLPTHPSPTPENPATPDFSPTPISQCAHAPSPCPVPPPPSLDICRGTTASGMDGGATVPARGLRALFPGGKKLQGKRNNLKTVKTCVKNLCEPLPPSPAPDSLSSPLPPQ